jgi:DNA-binding response OmpR family regulator
MTSSMPRLDAPAVIRSRRFERGAGCGAGCSGFLGHDPLSHAGYGILLAAVLAGRGLGPAVPRILRTGALTIDRPARLVTVDGHEVKLAPRESDLLFYLAAHVGQCCAHDDILSGAWGPEYVLGRRRPRADRRGSTNADWDVLRATINRMRVKLGPRVGTLLRNVYGRGYRLERWPPEGT